MEVIKISAIGIVGAMLAVTLKEYKKDYSLYIGLASSVIILFYIVYKLTYITEKAYELVGIISMDDAYMSILLKMVGITYIIELSKEICRDCGFNTLATQIGTFGKLSLFSLSIPIVFDLIELVSKL